MNFSVKSLGFSGQTNKNMACQSIRQEYGLYRVNFGNGGSNFTNQHGDSFSNSSKPLASQELPFGQRFLEAAKIVSKELQGNPNEIGKKIGEKLYGVK